MQDAACTSLFASFCGFCGFLLLFMLLCNSCVTIFTIQPACEGHAGVVDFFIHLLK